MAIFYKMEGPNVPWGDYGNVLFHGLVDADPKEPDRPVRLMRTGPFMPELTMSYGHILATNDLRTKLEEMNFNGISFQPAIKERIVSLDWKKWNLKADNPEKFPSGGEPENYVMGRKHNPKVAEQLPSVFSLKMPRVHSPLRQATFAYENFDPEIDLFEFAWSFYVTRTLRDWLQETVPDCVSFSRGERFLDA